MSDELLSLLVLLSLLMNFVTYVLLWRNERQLNKRRVCIVSNSADVRISDAASADAIERIVHKHLDGLRGIQ